MAFHFFLSLVPLVAVAGYVASHIVQRAGADAVIAPLLANAPQGIASLVLREVSRVASSGFNVAPLAALGFLWLASGGVHALLSALERVVDAPRRSWARKRAFAIGWVGVIAASVSLAAWALVVVEPVVAVDPTEHASAPAPEPSAREPRRRSTAAREVARTVRHRVVRIAPRPSHQALAIALSLSGTTALIAALYRFGVHREKRRVSRVFPGALLFVVVWSLVTWLFGRYAQRFADYAAFYGGLAVVAMLLVWLWLTSLVLLLGAELNAQLEGRRDQP